MSGQFSRLGLNCDFIYAIDGSKLRSSRQDLVRLCSDKYSLLCEGRPLVDAEFACSLSHLLIYQKMINEHLDVAVILEDDVRIGLAFRSFFDELHHLALRDDWEVLNLVSNTPSIPDKSCVFDIYSFSEFVEEPGRTGAYCLKLSAAEKLLGYGFPVRFAADGLLGRSPSFGVNLKGLLPEIVAVNDCFDSNIGTRYFHSSILNKATKYPRVTSH